MYQPLESPPALLPPKAKLVEVMNERDEPGESMKLLRSMVGGGEEGCGDALARLHATRDIPNHVGVDEMVAGLFFILDEGAHAVDQGSGFRAA